MAGPVFTPRVIRQGPGGSSRKATSKAPTLATSTPRWPSISPSAATVVSCGSSALSGVLWPVPTEGRDWTRTGIATGGYGTRLVTAGPTSAWMPLPGYGLYRTSNGTTWTKLT